MSSDIQTNACEESHEENQRELINQELIQKMALYLEDSTESTLETSVSSIDQTTEALDPSAETDSEEQHLFNSALPEARIYMNKAMILLGAMIMTSFLVYAPLEGVTHLQLILMGPLIYAITWMIVEKDWAANVLGEVWFKSGDLFKLFDAFNFIILMVIIQFRMMEIVSSCLYVALPFLIAAEVYVSHSKTLVRKRLLTIFTRYYYCVQVALALLNLDKYINCSWNLIFAPTWIFLAIKTCNCLILLYKAITKPHPTEAPKLLGFIWYLGFKGIMIIPFAAVYVFIQYYNSSNNTDFSFLYNIALASIGINSVLFAVGLLARENLAEFVLRMNLFESRLVEYGMEGQDVIVKKKVSFQVEKREVYFVMISSTYFIPLQDNLYPKTLEKLNKRKRLFNLGERLKQQKNNKLKPESLTEMNGLDKIEENSCYICCSNPSNVILMGCGHGGICYHCLVSQIKKKNECMQCRKEVAGLFIIDPHPKVNGIFKASEVHKLVV